MPCWYYEKEDMETTPSIKDGIDPGTEARYRREGSRFIIEAGTTQGLRYDTMATGVVYFHRFYMFHSFKEFPRYIMGAACLFLAGKVEETPKKAKDIIKIAKNILPEQHLATFGDDPKEEIMTHERILLQTIKFDLQVEHPYSYLLKYAKTFKGDKEKIQKLVQMAWTFVNDSLCTTLCLQWEPHIVGVAFLYLAGRLSKSDLMDWSGKSTKVKWWDQLTEDVSLDIMEEICHKLLDLYAAGQQKGAPSTPSKVVPGLGPPKRPKIKGPQDGESGHGEPKAKLIKQEHSREKQRPPPPPPPPSVGHAAPPVAQHEHHRQPSPVPPPPGRVQPSGYPSSSGLPHHGHQSTAGAPPTQAHPAPQQVHHQAPPPPRPAPNPAPPGVMPHQAPSPVKHHPPPIQQHHPLPAPHHLQPQPVQQPPPVQPAPPVPTVAHQAPYQQVPAYTSAPATYAYAAPQYNVPQYSAATSVPQMVQPSVSHAIPGIPPAPVATTAATHAAPSPQHYQMPGQFMTRAPPPLLAPPSYNRPPPATTQAAPFHQLPPTQAAVPTHPPLYRPPIPATVPTSIPGIPQPAPHIQPQYAQPPLLPGQLPPNPTPRSQVPPALPTQYQAVTHSSVPPPTSQYRTHTPPAHPPAPSPYSMPRSQPVESTPYAIPTTAASQSAPPPPGMAPKYLPPHTAAAPGLPTPTPPSPAGIDKSMLSIAQEYAAKQLQNMGVPATGVVMPPGSGYSTQQPPPGVPPTPPPGTINQQVGFSSGLATVRITGRDMGRRPSHGNNKRR